MNLETFFTKEDIQDIYENITIYSIKNYQTLPEEWQEIYKPKYQKALSNLENLNIPYEKIDQEEKEEVFTKLENYQQIYRTLLNLNQPVIELYASKIENKIIETIIKYPTEIERIAFLFQFITEYVIYSENYFKFCLQVPLIDGFDFDFKETIPVDSSISGMLVMGQGICDDIVNLMIYLGKKLGLTINKIFVDYNKVAHTLNTITLDNQIYLIDATRKIRKDKTTEECFLVSEKTLNKNNNYIFSNLNISKIDYSNQIPNYKQEVSKLIEEIKKLLPKQIDLNITKSNSLRK